MFRIGDFSKLTRVSIRMLRYYDEAGLFKPAKIDAFTGYRYYSAKQITTLNLIVSLRDMGFNISEISIAIHEQSEEKLKDLLIKKKNEVESNIESEKEKLRKISFTIKDLKKERVNMNYNVTLKSVPKYKVISLRDTIPAYDAEGMLWQRLGDFIMKKKIPCGDIAYATYHDEGYKEGPVDVEVIMNVKEIFTNEEGFEFKETEALEQAASIFVPGDYSNLTPAYIYLAKWIEENNYSICGNARQLCIKGPWNEQNPNDYLSEIQIPIKNIN